MREHPIPQDITGYRFHIIGSMTLKQFGELAAGAIVGLVIYSTNLPNIIKWPMIATVVGLGAAAAFLPFQERPLDHWLTTFVKVLYKPTKFFWKRQEKLPEAFTFEAHETDKNEEQVVDLTPARRQRIHEYLASVSSGPNYTQLDLAEQARIQEIMNTFTQVGTTGQGARNTDHKPNLKVRVRSMQHQQGSQLLAQDEVVVYEQQTQTTRRPLTKDEMAVTDVAHQVEIPVTEATRVEKIAEAAAQEAAQQSVQTAAYVESSEAPADASAPAIDLSATYNTSLPFPSKPTEPNKLVGMVLTMNNELVPEVIVEVKDENNRVVRAVKSNALGQFFISTPLKNGHYTLHFEHESFRIPSVNVALEDNIMDPIEVRTA